LNAGIRIVLLLLLAPAPVASQGFFDQFSYEGLGFSGIGLDGGAVWSNSLTSEPTVGVRVDYGQFAPRVRIVFGALYFRGQFNDAKIGEFERRLEQLVADPAVDIDVGTVSLTDVALYLDFQFVPAVLGRVRPYIGLGFGAHIRDGDGVAIANTFVEDALDTVAAGLSGSFGLDIALFPRLSLTAEVRGGLTSELRTLSARGGVMVWLP
jgi:hypothetical protein